MVVSADMPNRWCALAALLIGLPRVAIGQPHKELDAAGAVAGAAADEALYSCGTHKGPIAVTLKPETEVKELVTWVMGFTLSLIHISEPTRLLSISYAVFCL